MEVENQVRNWIKDINKDYLAKKLIENSNLTNTQLETYLIHLLSDQLTQNKIKLENKSKMRLKGKISRGSFNRTLKQAQKNIISAIYTILLLGYLGIFDSPALSQYIEVSNQLESYVDTYREVWNKGDPTKEEDLKLLRMIQEQLEERLSALANPKSLTNRL
ncbi:MAG: hypothetical protein QXJ75_02750 [Candidatus Bathyarchaeia archaeon]